MIDVNLPLRKAYFTALTGIVYNSIPVPVYYSFLPDDLDPDYYIIYGGISNADAGNISSEELSSSMRVTAYTKATKFNDGNAADAIGGEILQRIRATPSFNIALDDDTLLQMTGTQLDSDVTQDWSLQTSKIYIDRIFIFRHQFYIK